MQLTRSPRLDMQAVEVDSLFAMVFLATCLCTSRCLDTKPAEVYKNVVRSYSLRIPLAGSLSHDLPYTH